MGMYTEIYVNVDLIEDTPEEVIAVLKAICGGEDKTSLEDKPDRWSVLFNSGNYSVPNTSCKSLTYDSTINKWSLLGKGDIKNYEQEIESFFAWLMPYIDADYGEFIGYYRYEEDEHPMLVYCSSDD